MILYYAFFIALGYAFTVNFLEGVALIIGLICLVLSVAFYHGLQMLINE